MFDMKVIGLTLLTVSIMYTMMVEYRSLEKRADISSHLFLQLVQTASQKQSDDFLAYS